VAKPAAAKSVTPKSATRLSYKEQRELAGLPAQLEELEARKAQMQAVVSDPGFYSRPHPEVAAQLATLAEIDARIDAAFARWSQLEGA
jgi:ATP-binding cassette subfamily F protein uup